jgi:hypothetical protein
MNSTKALVGIAFLSLLFWAGVGASLLTGAVVDLGRNIPQTRLIDDYLWGVLWSFVLGASIGFWPVHNTDKLWLLAIWIGKSFVCLVLMLYYEAAYWFLDSFSYFAVPALGTFPEIRAGEPQGTRMMYDLVWLQLQVMPDSFHAVKLTCAYVGLVAVHVIYRAAVIFMGKDDIRVLLIIAMFPSTLFWSSILGKDPIVLLGIGLFVLGSVGWHARGVRGYLLALAAGIAVLAGMRPWLVPIFLIPLVLLVLMGKPRSATKVIAAASGTGAAIWSMAITLEALSLDSVERIVLMVEALERAGTEFGGSGQAIGADLRNPVNLLAFIPLGMFTALFRPFPGEVPGLFGTIAGLENLVVLAMFVCAIARGRLEDLRQPAVAAAVLLLLLWAVAYGFISYQNLGGAVRFRLQVLPILLLLCLYFGSRRGRSAGIAQSPAAAQ